MSETPLTSLHPFLPKSQCPASQTSWVSAEEEASHLLGAQPTRRQSGGAMGWAEGEGEKGKNKVLCVFFFTSFTGRGICRRGFPLGPLSGDHACPGALSPSLVGPLSFMPSRGLQPSLQPRGKAVRWWEGGCVPRRRGPGLSISKGDGHLGNPSRTGETGDEGLTDPTSTQSLGGRWIRKARVPSSPALGRHPA